MGQDILSLFQRQIGFSRTLHKLRNVAIILALAILVEAMLGFLLLSTATESAKLHLDEEAAQRSSDQLVALGSYRPETIRGIVVAIDESLIVISSVDGDVALGCFTESARFCLRKVSVSEYVEASYFMDADHDLPSLYDVLPVSEGS